MIAAMTFKGHIERGQIVLEDGVRLPEGASVVVELLPLHRGEILHPDIQRFTGIIPRNVDARSEHRAASQAKHT